MSVQLCGRIVLLGLLLSSAAFAQPQPVSVSALSAVALPAVQRAPAEVLPGNDSVLASELALPVDKVLVEVGMQVEAGQLLVELDRRDPQLQRHQAAAQVQAAKARLTLASQRLLRGRELAAKQFSSADDLLALEAAEAGARADLQIAESALALAERSLDKTRIRAPFAGEVSERMAQVGALAVPGTALVRLVERGDAEVEARIPAALADGLESGSELYFEGPGKRLPLSLLRLGEVIDARGRTRVARLAFSDEKLPPGSSGSLVWRAAGLSIPAHLLVQRDTGIGVFRVIDGLARFTLIPGAVAGRSAVSLLDPASLIVVDGQQRLRDGDPVSAGAP